MKTNYRNLNISKTQVAVIIVILALGVFLGKTILDNKSTGKAADNDHGHGRQTQAKTQGESKGQTKAGKDDHGHDHAKEHGENTAHKEEQAKGPHGGKMFADGDFGLEALLSGGGGEPRLKVWLLSFSVRDGHFFRQRWPDRDCVEPLSPNISKPCS